MPVHEIDRVPENERKAVAVEIAECVLKSVEGKIAPTS
jgi:hypothetical protein